MRALEGCSTQRSFIVPSRSPHAVVQAHQADTKQSARTVLSDTHLRSAWPRRIEPPAHISREEPAQTDPVIARTAAPKAHASVAMAPRRLALHGSGPRRPLIFFKARVARVQTGRAACINTASNLQPLARSDSPGAWRPQNQRGRVSVRTRSRSRERRQHREARERERGARQAPFVHPHRGLTRAPDPSGPATLRPAGSAPRDPVCSCAPSRAPRVLSPSLRPQCASRSNYRNFFLAARGVSFRALRRHYSELSGTTPGP